jgi:hypothetical protein
VSTAVGVADPEEFEGLSALFIFVAALLDGGVSTAGVSGSTLGKKEELMSPMPMKKSSVPKFNDALCDSWRKLTYKE